MSASSNDPVDKVRELQRTLWRAAKQHRGRRFHALYDRIYRSDVLWEAWRRVRANRGAAGVDGETLAAFRTGNATLKFNQIDHYVRQRLGLFLARRRGYQHRHVAISQWSFDWFRGLGLHRLYGTVRYPGAVHA